MPVKSTLPSDIHRRLESLGAAIGASSPDIEFAYLFGSMSIGRPTPRSDVDLAIHLAAGSDAHNVRLDVTRAAARHLRTDAVDVVVLNSASTSLAGRILATRRVILDRQPFVRHRYESVTARMFQDFRVREHRLLTARAAHG